LPSPCPYGFANDKSQGLINWNKSGMFYQREC